MKKVVRLFKNIIIILFVLILTINIFSCLNVKNRMKFDEKLKYDFDTRIGNDIIEGLKEQDCNKISSVFCKKIANTKYLDDNINYLFRYINGYGGLIIPNGKWVLRASGHSSYNGWGKVVDYGGWDYDKEIIIGEKKYNLYCNAYFILKGNKNFEGITHIYLLEVTNNFNEDFLKKTIKAINEKGSQVIKYLGVGIFDMNYDTYLDENIVPKEIYENEEYRFSLEELEKNRDRW